MTRVIAAIADDAAAQPVVSVAEAVADLLGAEVEVVHARQGRPTIATEIDGRPVRALRGPVVASLLELAAGSEVAALVAGSRGHPHGPRPAGHVARSLACSLDKPLVLVPPQASVPAKLRRVLVPLKGTPQTAASLATTVELARDAALEIVVVHVYTQATLPRFLDRPHHDLEAWAAEFLARYVSVPAAAVYLWCRVGRPPEELLRVAAEAEVDLIALGWGRDLSPGRATMVRAALAASGLPVVLLPTLPAGSSAGDLVRASAQATG